jgi:hypothetical protein
LAIVALVLWTITAAAGVSLLATGGAARRLAAETERAQAETAPAASTPVRIGAVPLTADGKPPPAPKVRVATPPGEHPLLEFSHPALAITGLACWFMFVFVHYRPFAWISFGVLVAALALGLSWLVRNAQAARRHATAAWNFPPQLVALHGAAAAVAIALTVLTALSASH